MRWGNVGGVPPIGGTKRIDDPLLHERYVLPVGKPSKGFQMIGAEAWYVIESDGEDTCYGIHFDPMELHQGQFQLSALIACGFTRDEGFKKQTVSQLLRDWQRTSEADEQKKHHET